jgi:alpha/beta superfamily hydrolase
MSFFHNSIADPEVCVVYLHANNGSRVEGLQYLGGLLMAGYNVCLFDFSGSGLSQGEYISLGFNEATDL